MHKGYFKHWAPSVAGCIAVWFDWLCHIFIIIKYSYNMKATKEAELNVQYLFFENVGYLFKENCTDLPLHPPQLLMLLPLHEKHVMSLIVATVWSFDQ